MCLAQDSAGWVYPFCFAALNRYNMSVFLLAWQNFFYHSGVKICFIRSLIRRDILLLKQISESSSCAINNLNIKQVLEQKGSAAILDVTRSAGVALEVDLRKHCTQVVKYTRKRSTLALTLRTEVIKSLKEGYQWPHKKNWCSPKFKKKSIFKLWSFILRALKQRKVTWQRL